MDSVKLTSSTEVDILRNTVDHQHPRSQSSTLVSIDQPTDQLFTDEAIGLLNCSEQIDRSANLLGELIRQRSCSISERIAQLEYLIGQLKFLVLTINDNRQSFSTFNRTMQNLNHQLDHHPVGVGVDKQQQSSMSTQLVQLVSTATSMDSSSRPTMEPESFKINCNVLELKQILTNIDMHLAMLKDVEEKHAHICEEYGKDLKCKEEALMAKSDQLVRLNHQVLQMQNKLQHLSQQNRQLETEVQFYKVSSRYESKNCFFSFCVLI